MRFSFEFDDDLSFVKESIEASVLEQFKPSKKMIERGHGEVLITDSEKEKLIEKDVEKVFDYICKKYLLATQIDKEVAVIIPVIDTSTMECHIHEFIGGKCDADYVITVNLKNPDALHDAIKEEINKELYEGELSQLLSDQEKELIADFRIEEVYKKCKEKWFEYGEYITVVFNTKDGTAVVQKNK